MVSGMVRVYMALCLFALGVAAETLSVSKYGVIGTGCPPGSATVDVDNSLRKIRVRVSDFEASAGPGIAYSEGRKNCRVTISVDIPEGYQFTTDSAVVKASYTADKGVTVSSSSLSYFQSQLEQGTGSSSVSGPARADANLVNNLSPDIWSSCGGAAIIIVGTDLRVINSANKSGAGYVRVKDSFDTNFAWRKC